MCMLTDSGVEETLKKTSPVEDFSMPEKQQRTNKNKTVHIPCDGPDKISFRPGKKIVISNTIDIIYQASLKVININKALPDQICL